MSKEILDLLIIEKGNAVEMGAKSNYTYEGIFTEFGVRNKNKRIYSKNQFLPHVESLQKVIKEGKLLGELDHPKDFEIQLSRASHVIENLRLDETGKKILGKIKLMDTAKGKDAKAIADAGVPLHISSRAAGSVNESGVVEVKKLFTYDLVADPGFANAELSAVAESLNVSEARAAELQHMVTESASYGADELELINESFGLDNNCGIEIYQIKKKADEKLMEAEDKKDIFKDSKSDKVTVEQMTKWSDTFVEEVQKSIDKKMNELSESADNKRVEKLETFLSEFTKEVNERFSQFHEFTDYLSEGLNQIKTYSDYMNENMNGLKTHNDYIIEGMNAISAFTDEMVENMNTLKLESEGTTDKLNNAVGYSEKAHMEIADLKTHNNHIVENSNALAEFMDHVAEKTNQGINYTESVSEGAKYLKEFAEHIAAEVSVIKEGKIAEHNAHKVEDSIMESTTIDSADDYKSNFSSKLEELIAEAKKEKEESINNKINESKGFIELLPKNYQEQFETLPDDKKQKFKEVAEGVENGEKAVELFESIINENKSENWIEYMPEKYKQVWESSTEAIKNKISMQAEGYELTNQAQIDWFWDTRNMRVKTENPIKKAINESTNSAEGLGYTINVNAIVNNVKNIHG
jgi:methyl-accepting chemotaxis protein